MARTPLNNLQAPFDEFTETPGNRIEQFTYSSRFGWGARHITISFVRHIEGAEEHNYLVFHGKTEK